MKEYHKIQTIYKRKEDKSKALIEGEFSTSTFEFLQGVKWVWTEKVDGTNIRVQWNGEVVTFGGKTDNAQIPNGLVNWLNAKFNTPEGKELLSQIFPKEAEGPTEVCLYGEGYGAKIQSGGVYRQDQSFVLFDIKIGPWWLERPNVLDIAGKLGLDVVPVAFEGTLLEAVEFVRKGYKSAWGDFIAEGLVGRPAVELRDRAGHRIIAKIKHRDFK